MENSDEEKLKINSIKMARKERSLTKHLGFYAVINLIFWYGIAFGIWGLALKLNFLLFIVIGVVVALLITTFCSAPLFFMKRTPEHNANTMFFIGIWVKLAVVIAIIGLFVWVF